MATDEQGYCGWSDLPVGSCAHCTGTDDSWMDDRRER